MTLKAIYYRFLGYKTFDQLFNEMKKGRRQSIAQNEIEKARKLEIALLPKSIHFPVDGEIYEAIADSGVSYLTHHMAPYTGGGDAVLEKGTRIIIRNPGAMRSSAVNAHPVNYDDIEKKIIPADIKENPNYGGYSISVRIKTLHKHFKRIPEPET